MAAAGEAYAEQWNELLEHYRKQFPEVAAEFELALSGLLAAYWAADLPVYGTGESEIYLLGTRFEMSHRSS